MDIQPPPTVHLSPSIDKESSGIIVDSQFTPPWPDWKDDEVNAENWMEGTENGFVDPSGTILPFRIAETHAEWVRPSEIFSEPPPVVLLGTQQSSSTMDLISPNAHLCELSEVIRFILSDICELYELSLQEDFDCEGENSVYIPNSDHPWKPWDHIYSLCWAGVKGSKPLFNPSGRYLVRLYYMGCWRRITVDDRIPLLANGVIGLPMTSCFELWPMLLTKALLKVASLTWDDSSPNSFQGGDQHNYFNTISCLTGFIGCHWNISNPVDDQALWLYLNNVLPKYKRPQFPKRPRKHQNRDQQEADIVDSIFSLHPVPPTPSASEMEVNQKPNTSSKNKDRKKRKKQRDKLLLTGGTSVDSATMEESSSVADAATASATDDEKKSKKKSSKRRKKVKKTIIIKDNEATTSEDENQREETMENKLTGKKSKKNKKGHHGGKETEDDRLSEGNNKKNKKHKKGKQKKEKPPLHAPSTEEEEEEDAEFEGECEPIEFDLIESEKLIPASTQQQHKLEKCKNNKDPPPSIQEIIRGVQQYSGPLIQSAMSNLDKHLGQDDPITVTVLFRNFPNDEDDKVKLIPPFLHYHPVQLAEVRDEPAYKETCRPPTPLWKTYRWKEWAMKKELIPMDSSFNSHKQIRSVLVKTPFPLKSDWHPRLYSLYEYYYQEKSHHDDYPLQLLPIPFKIPAGATMDMVKRLVHNQSNRTPDPPPQSAVTPSSTQEEAAAVVMRVGSHKKDKKDHDDDEIESLSQLGHQGSTSKSRSKKDNKNSSRTSKTKRRRRETKSTGDEVKKEVDQVGGESEKNKFSKKKIKRRKHKVQTTTFKQKSDDEDGQTTQNEEIGRPTTTDEEGKEKSKKKKKKKKDKSKEKLDKKFIENSTKVLLPYTNNVNVTTGDDDDMSSGKETLLSSTWAPPSQACQNLWIDVEDVARNLVKFSKFYSAKNEFGSHYVLRRNPKKVATFMKLREGQHHHHHNLTKSNENLHKTTEIHHKEEEDLKEKVKVRIPVISHGVLKDFNNESGSLNVTIRFGRGHEIDVKDWHMNNIDDLDSGFYLFSDSWTQHELIFSLDVLLESTVLKFSHHRKSNETKVEKRPITVIVKNWDWRHDCCLEGNVIVISSNHSCLTHLPLPPGRHLFRIWLLDKVSPETDNGSAESGNGHQSLKKMSPDSHFSLKILSQCPIHLGSRVEAQNLMTNLPVQFLRQADMLTRSLWALLLSFGHKRPIVAKSLKNLYQSYCPTYDEPNIINKILKSVHGSFERAFFHMIQHMNKGRVDKWMLFAIRSLLLSPYLGQTTVEDRESNVFKEKMMVQHKLVRERAESILLDLEERHNLPVIVCAARKIQRFFRGWQVRRYFQVRVKGHPYFDKLELQVRQIAFLLASNSDSKFAFPSPNAREQSEHLKRSRAHVIPRPPRWAVDLLQHLLSEHPWLITIYPHAYSTPFHLKIRDVSGIVPGWDTDKLDDVEWIPFYRQSIFMPEEPNLQFAADLTSLQSISSNNEQLIMEVVNNDRNEQVSIPASNRLFLGRLETNNHGYTIFCYKLTRKVAEIDQQHVNRHEDHSKIWTLRLMTPDIQKLPLLGEAGSVTENNNDTVEVKKLCLNRFSGYYIPNDDFCICRYTIEIAHPVSYISVRFKAFSLEAVSLRLSIWDLDTQKMVFEHRNTGSFILPSIRLEGTNQQRAAPAAAPPLHHSDSVDLVTKYLSELNTNEEEIMGQASNKNNEDEDILQRSTSAPNLGPKEPIGVVQKYALGIFVEDRSWPLTDGEWKFVQYQTKKFWKRMMVFQDQASADQVVQSSLVGTEGRDQNGKFGRVSLPKNSVENFDDDNSTTKSQQEVKEENVGSDPIKEETMNDSNNDSIHPANISKEAKTDNEQMSSSSTNDKFLDSTINNETENDVEQTNDVSKFENNMEGEVSIVSSTGFEAPSDDMTLVDDMTVPPPDENKEEKEINNEEVIEPLEKQINRNNGRGDDDDDDEDFVSEDEDFVPTIVESANLIVHEGGKDSQQIKDVSKPHWSLEIVTDADQQCTFQSNRRTFQERLIQTKKEWENQQQGRYLQGRRLRHKFLAKHLVPIDATDADPFAFIEPMSKFYSCLYLDKSQLDGLNLEDWLPKTKTPSDSIHPTPSSKKFKGSAVGTMLTKSPKSSKKKKNGGSNNKKVQKKAASVGSGRKQKDASKTSKTRGTSTPVPPKQTKSKKQQPVRVNKRGKSKERRKKGKLGSEKEQILTDNETEEAEVKVMSETSSAPPENEEDGKQRSSIEKMMSITPLELTPMELPAGKKYCAPPPRNPTHILLGPDLQKCGIKPGSKGFPVLDNKQLLSDIRGVVPWKKFGGFGGGDDGKRTRKESDTHHHHRQARVRVMEEEWQMKHVEAMQNFLNLLQNQSFVWNHFNQHVHSNVFCDLEENRELLEKYRLHYEQTHLLRSPGRSSVDLNVKSVQEIRDFMKHTGGSVSNISSKDVLSYSKNSLLDHKNVPSGPSVPLTDHQVKHQQHDTNHGQYIMDVGPGYHFNGNEDNVVVPSTNRTTTTASSKVGPYTQKSTPNLSAKTTSTA